MVFGANTVVFGANTVVFEAYTVNFRANVVIIVEVTVEIQRYMRQIQ